MILKKFQGKTIKEAKKRAAAVLGEDFIVMESKEGSNGKQAFVTVMADQKREAALRKTKNTNKKTGTNKTTNLLPETLSSLGEAVSDGFYRLTSSIEGSSSTSNPKFVRQRVESSTGIMEEEEQETGGGIQSENDLLTMSRRSTPLLNNDRKNSTGKNINEAKSFQEQFNNHYHKQPVSKEVKALHRRFDHMENLLSEALISANLRYVSHPAFQQLLETGMQAPMISRWFEDILNKGMDPYEDQKAFMFELAETVRNALSFALPAPAEQNLLFIGPAGSGKTTLIMKLVTNPDFMQSKSVALVSIEPESDFKRYSALKLFAEDQELDYYRIKDGVEASKLMSDLENYDHVLFDSPSISLQRNASLRDFWKLRQILSSISPIEVHYVINATLERYFFTEEYADSHPLQPDYLAISHLDETRKWGHLVPFLKGKKCSVRYVSNGPHIPDDLQIFKPSWFAEKILSES